MKDIRLALISKSDFFEDSSDLFDFLSANNEWNEGIRARKTSTLGQPNASSEQKEFYKPLYPIMHELSDCREPFSAAC